MSQCGDPITEFDARVRAKVAGGMERRKAVAAVAKGDRELHEAYLLATNTGRKTHDLIRERFEFAASPPTGR